MKSFSFGFLLLGSASLAQAEVMVAPLFTDHCVLQREKPVAVWGNANPGQTVTVEFHGLAASATAGMDSVWTAHLPALSGTGKGGDLVIRGDNTITLHDVVVGEVWLCSGQSNMEFPVDNPKGLRVQNAEAEVAAANYPFIRQFKVRKQVGNRPLIHASGAWETCSPKTVGQFSAVGYFFAREISRRLSVPIGIINSTWGGTPIESWISSATLASDPAFGVVQTRWQKALRDFPQATAQYQASNAKWHEETAAARAAGTDSGPEFLKLHPAPHPPIGAPTGDSWMPSGLFNGMIEPLVPYAMRGILWYQGESNAKPVIAEEYHQLFAALITSWRKEFAQGDLPFYWVQLAGFDHNPSWPILREQQQAALSLPNTGQAIAIDIGQEDNIHPRNKQEVGRRLALIANNQVYKMPVEYCGPMFANAVIEGAAMRVWFNFCADGLRADQPVQTCELAGEDHKFFPATAVVEGNSLVVRSVQVPKPVAVRYAWKGFAEGHLYNSAGLPAAPFRSDNW